MIKRSYSVTFHMILKRLRMIDILEMSCMHNFFEEHCYLKLCGNKHLFVFGHIMSYSVTFWGPWNYPGEFWLWCTSINTLLKIQVSTSIKQSTCPHSNYTIYTIKPQIVTIIIELFVGFSIYLFLFFLSNVHRR